MSTTITTNFLTILLFLILCCLISISTYLFLTQYTTAHILSQDLSALQDAHAALSANHASTVSRLKKEIVDKEVEALELLLEIVDKAKEMQRLTAENAAIVNWLQTQAQNQVDQVQNEVVRRDRSLDIYKASIEDLTRLLQVAQAEVDKCKASHSNGFQAMRAENMELGARNGEVQRENEYLRVELKRLEKGDGEGKEEIVPWALNEYGDVQFMEGVEAEGS
jgi:hypothetical protein